MRKFFALSVAACILGAAVPALAAEASVPAMFQVSASHAHKVVAKAKKKKARANRKYYRKNAKAKGKAKVTRKAG